MSSAFDIKSSIVLGNELRVLLNSDHISYGEIDRALKEKGVFVGNNEKSVTVPLLSATLLTPDEFLKLIESSVSRESREKVKPLLSLELVAKESDWISPLKKSLFLEEFQALSNKGNEEFSIEPQVIVDGKNKISISYSIIRKDYSQDFLKREIIFEGKITIEQQDNALKLDFSSSHSSKETEAINRKITSRISKILNDSNLASMAKPQQITFDSFTNKERVRFFKRLTAGFPKCLALGTVNDIEISLDKTLTLPDDPQIAWMNQAVQRLKIDGDRLNDIFLINDEKYYDYYHILRIDVTFPFTEAANSGECEVSFSFSHVGRNKADISSSELTFELTRINYKNSVNSESKKTISAVITKAVHSLIKQKYEQLISDRTNLPA
jgi:hypothetical protein